MGLQPASRDLLKWHAWAGETEAVTAMNNGDEKTGWQAQVCTLYF